MGMKRGQFYIMTAVMFCVVAYTALVSVSSPDPEQDERLNEIVDNFALESAKVINYAVRNDYNVTKAMYDFARDFETYLDSFSFDMGFAYILYTRSDITVTSFLEEVGVSADEDSYELGYLESVRFAASDQVKLVVNRKDYLYDIPDEPIGIKLL